MKNNEQTGEGFRKQHPKDVLFYILLRKAHQPYKTHKSTDQLGVFSSRMGKYFSSESENWLIPKVYGNYP